MQNMQLNTHTNTRTHTPVPSLPPLHGVLTELGISQADLVRGAGLSKAAACRLVTRGEWPKRDLPEVRQRLGKFLRQRGANGAHLRDAMPAADTSLPDPLPTPYDNQEDITVLLRNESLSPAARKAFGLHRNPFADELQTRDDVFASAGIRYVRASLHDAAKNHGFVAIVGESGSGKSTLAEDLEQRIADTNEPIVVIRPYVVAMEDSDSKGKPLRAPAIGEAIIRTLTPSTHCKSSPDARFAQIHSTLKASAQAGYSHLILIEEAHCLPLATIKHLKRFLELKVGLRRLVGVALVGQPELLAKLSEQNPEVREVVQRCEIVKLPALDNDLEAYLGHKFARAGADAAKILRPDAYDAIRARLIRMPRGGRAGDALSVCHPLVVNNLVARAMNQAAVAGFDQVDADVIAGC
ncbi:ExeA family protein [Ideonella sp.]|uniref:ExeA family protein n=1 Tax=Ideonella sp. TaxID=1929293 RepID=UPI003BB6A489